MSYHFFAKLISVLFIEELVFKIKKKLGGREQLLQYCTYIRNKP